MIAIIVAQEEEMMKKKKSHMALMVSRDNGNLKKLFKVDTIKKFKVNNSDKLPQKNPPLGLR